MSDPSRILTPNDVPLIEIPRLTMKELGYTLPEVSTDWRQLDVMEDGASWRNDRRSLVVILSVAREYDGDRWVHISCSHRKRLPTWGELRLVKETFIGDGYAYQVFPPKKFYVNIHPNVLHLFHNLDNPRPLPEFSQGTGSL